MSRGAPFGTDLPSGGGLSGFGTSAFGVSPFSSGAYGSHSYAKPAPLAAAAFNGGIPATAGGRSLLLQQRSGGSQGLNPISWRKDSPAGFQQQQQQQGGVTLPSVAGATPQPGQQQPQPTVHTLNGLQYPVAAPAASASSQPPFVNQAADSGSRARALSGVAPGSFSAAQDYNARASAPPAPPAKFHRSRSSFIPNKWTRGPGDGTFGSVYLSFGGGGADYGGRVSGGGPNMAFDRVRPEELWEQEQERKRALLFATSGAGQQQQQQRQAKKSTKKQAAYGAPKSSKAKSKAAARAARAEAQARKLLARARTQLLSHLSSASCRLFSDADHVVAVSDDDLDELLRAGGGDAAKVIAHLTTFDQENRKFDDFATLMLAVQQARRDVGDHGAGTELEARPAGADEEQKEASPAAGDDSVAQADSPPAAASAAAAPSKKSSGGTSSRGLTVAEKRAARQAEEDAAKLAAEQEKKAKAAKASAARAKKAEAEAKKRAEEKEAEAEAAAVPAPVVTPRKKAAAAAAGAKKTPATKDATETKDAADTKEPAAASDASSSAKAAASPSKADDEYGEDFAE